MAKSKVYFTNFRSQNNISLLEKLEKLVKSAGIEKINFQNKFVAIKIHFGEIGNVAYLRPNYAKTIVDLIKENGGRPFLTDCNTLYVGKRRNGLDHIETAYENGFNPFSTGCHVIIADGLKGTDEAIIPINGKHVKMAKIGRAISDADVFISLSHFKGHEFVGFGGALKNIGMGCGSRAGKMEMHSSGQPFVAHSVCVGCGKCVENCRFGAISLDEKSTIDHTKCVGCGRCIRFCPNNAVMMVMDEANDILNEKIAEYAYAVVKDKPHFHINFVMDVSPCCDCYPYNDVPIVPDVGMFASFDPVALDMACVDMVNKQPILQNSILGENTCMGNHFMSVHPDTNWQACFEHAVKIGLGNQEYELVEIE
jgi:Uncharacterized Fe-S center protein